MLPAAPSKPACPPASRAPQGRHRRQGPVVGWDIGASAGQRRQRGRCDRACCHWRQNRCRVRCWNGCPVSARRGRCHLTQSPGCLSLHRWIRVREQPGQIGHGVRWFQPAEHFRGVGADHRARVVQGCRQRRPRRAGRPSPARPSRRGAPTSSAARPGRHQRGHGRRRTDGRQRLGCYRLARGPSCSSMALNLGSASSACSKPTGGRPAAGGLVGIGQSRHQQGHGGRIAHPADGLSHLVADKQVRVAQVNQEDGQQGGIVREAKGARRRGTRCRDRVIQPAYRNRAYLQANQLNSRRSSHIRRRAACHQLGSAE